MQSVVCVCVILFSYAVVWCRKKLFHSYDTDEVLGYLTQVCNYTVSAELYYIYCEYIYQIEFYIFSSFTFSDFKLLV